MNGILNEKTKSISFLVSVILFVSVYPLSMTSLIILGLPYSFILLYAILSVYIYIIAYNIAVKFIYKKYTRRFYDIGLVGFRSYQIIANTIWVYVYSICAYFLIDIYPIHIIIFTPIYYVINIYIICRHLIHIINEK